MISRAIELQSKMDKMASNHNKISKKLKESKSKIMKIKERKDRSEGMQLINNVY
jgi:hypothetical protein